jgi:hypothetical protein
VRTALMGRSARSWQLSRVHGGRSPRAPELSAVDGSLPFMEAGKSGE